MTFSLHANEDAKEGKIARYVMENIQKDYVNCYSFYKVASESFRKAGKDKELINSLEKSADAALKYNNDLGEFMGLNPEVIYKKTKDKVNDYIKNGVKGITFKHNLSHIESCYEISTSDIGIFWRKNGWGYNGEVSTKVKKYQFYGLEIINNMKIKVGVVTSINKLNNLDNIIQNFKKQLYFSKYRKR